jgi:hypothetical protein
MAMVTESGRVSEHDDLPSIDRLLTLSDGVVAIALTLLVLQLRVPPLSQVSDANSPAQLAAALGREGDQLVSPQQRQVRLAAARPGAAGRRAVDPAPPRVGCVIARG